MRSLFHKSPNQTLSRTLKTYQKTKDAFTLIELLVVIAIIAILAAILFPVFGKARENARRSSCMSNMKQLALAAQQYTQDYDENMLPGRIPANYFGTGNPPTNRYFHWGRLLAPYTKSEQIYTCPSNSDRRQGYTLNASVGGNPNRVVASITFVSQLVMFMDGVGTANLPDNQAQTFFIGDLGTSYGRHFGRIVVDGADAVGSGTCRTGGLSSPGRHLEGANYAFADGHTKWLKYTEVADARAVDSGSGSTCSSPVAPELVDNGVYYNPHREGVVYQADATQIGGALYR